MTSGLRRVFKGPAALAEEPLWHPMEKQLYWIDITKRQVNKLDVNTGKNKFIEFPELIGTIVPNREAGLIATVGDRILRINFDQGDITPLTHIKEIAAHDYLRFNDGKCDSMGRFWIGVASDDANKKGKLLRMDSDGSIQLMEEDVIFSNGMGWSPNHKKFYYVDSGRKTIYQYTFLIKTGEICDRTVFFQCPQEKEKPDGLTVDAAGNIWVAFWNGSKVCQFSETGVLKQEIKLPVQRPTSCMLGGGDYKTLFVTSCSRDINENESLPSPAGSIFAKRVEIPGIPEFAFGG